MNDGHRAVFLREYLRAPFTVAAVTPSGEPLAARGHQHADVIVSGLPWAAFARWTSSAQRMRRRLGDRFEEVVTGRTVWGNVPPAFAYFCRRPRVPARPHALLSA